MNLDESKIIFDYEAIVFIISEEKNMKDKLNKVEDDELTDEQLENVVGGIELNNDPRGIVRAGQIGKVNCPSCGGVNIVKSFKNRSYVTFECQDCGHSWEDRAF